MEVQEILSEIEFADGVYKEEALDAAINKKEEVIPYLIDILNDVYANPKKYAGGKPAYQNHIYAMMLLGYFKETKAHDVLIKILSIPDFDLHDIFDDCLTENMPAILVATCGGDIEQIINLAFNKNAYRYSRLVASETITYAYLEGFIDRDGILNIFRRLMLEAIDSEMCSSFACDISHICPIELRDEISKGYEQGRILEYYLSEDDFNETYEDGLDNTLNRLRSFYENRKIINIHKSMSWWACFNEDNDFQMLPINDESYNEASQSNMSLYSKEAKKKIKAKRKMAKASKKMNRRRKK